MKKFLLLALSLLTALTLSFAVACNEGESSSESVADSSVVEESTGGDSESSNQGGDQEVTLSSVEYVSGIENLELGAPIELDELVLKLSYSDGSEENVAYADLDESALSATCDTSKLGASVATIVYKGFTVEASLRVYCWADSVTVPASFSKFVANKGEKSDFKDKTQSYKVGDDSPFYFSPIVAAWNYNGDLLYFDSIGEVEIVANLYILTNGEYVLVENTADYVEIDALNASFDFTESANNNSFKLSVYPRVLEDAGEDESTITELTKSLEFTVVDGYNVYNAAELLLWDNHNEGVTAHRTANGVTVDSNTINALVLHDNIALTASDIPAVFLYDRERDADEFAGLSEEKKNRLQGSLKDSNDTVFIMQRNLGETGTFTFEGNYFTIDASEVPYVEKERGDNTLNILSTSVVSHMPLFAIVGEADTDDTTATENFDVKNVNFIGNLNRQEDVKNSGGLILIKYLYAKGTTYNVVSKGWYINAFAFLNATGHEVTFDSCVFEDSYSCLIYSWGGLINIKNSRIYGAGGPAIIADHAYPNDAKRGRTGSYGWTSNIVVDDASVVASYVTGQEAWFAEFKAQAAAAGISALDAIFNSFNRTYVTIKKDEGGNDQRLLNLMIVIKSGDAAGMTFDPISSRVEIGSSHVLDFDSPYTAAFLNGFSKSGAPIFQGSTETGIIAYAGQNPQMPQLPLLYTLQGAQTMTPVDFLTGEHYSLPIAQDSGYLNLYYAAAGSAGYMGIVLGDYRAL